MNLKYIMKNNCKWHIGTVLGILLVLMLLAGSADAAPYAYITNNGDNTVSVIDTATNTVTATVNVGTEPYGVAVNPAGTKVYVANDGSNTVSVIDTATDTVTATVHVGTGPGGVAINPTGTKIYVANYYSNTVSVIDTVTNTVTIVHVKNPWRVAVNPAGTKIYVPDWGGKTVSVIDTTTDTVTTTVNVGDAPEGIAVNPAGTKAYVANYGSNTVSVIDIATNTVTVTVNVGKGPLGIAVNPEGTKVYVANYGSNTISVIDTATNVVTATVNVGTEPIAIGQFIGPVVVQIPTLPLLSVSPDPSFNFATSTGSSAFGTFLISNTGGGILTWSVIGDQPWITINPTGGENSGVIRVNISTADLSPGNHSGTITITSNGGTRKGSISLYIQPSASERTTTTPSYSAGTPSSGTPSYLPEIPLSIIVAIITAVAMIIVALINRK